MTTPDTNPVTTGWDNGLMQDYDKGLSRALSEKPDSREVVRNVFPDAVLNTSNPVAWRIWSPDGTNVYQYTEDGDGEPLYTQQPAPVTSQPLTLDQIHEALLSVCGDGSAPTSTDDPEFLELIVPLARAIEAKIKEGGA